MIKLLDGPAQGTYLAHRAPIFLRAVIDQNSIKRDVLDQVEDQPREIEKVHIYQIQGVPQTIHLNLGKKRGNGFYQSAEYHHLTDVDGERLRDNNQWQQWCLERQKEEE